MTEIPIIQAVVVVYRRVLVDCESIQSLARINKSDPDIYSSLRVLIQDNSPAGQPAEACPLPASDFVHCPENPGLADAYNRALSHAFRNRARWLMLLDQDTDLSAAYLRQVVEAVSSGPRENICAFAPKLYDGNRLLSPYRVSRRSMKIVPAGFVGRSDEMLWPFSSGSVISVDALHTIGGFAPDYPLDYLDNITFSRLYRAGFVTCVLDARLQHSLSYLDMEHKMSLSRYRTILAAHWKVCRENGIGISPIRYRIRLILRGLKQALLFKNKRYSIESFRSALSRFPERASVQKR
jgi:GT2 family glycosyltransferase